ncbi:MAG: hypothetical protein ACFBSE_03385 [Prochloraceae cyanobacterium]
MIFCYITVNLFTIYFEYHLLISKLRSNRLYIFTLDDNSCFYFVGEYAIERAKMKLSNQISWKISHIITKQPLNLYIKSIWSRELKPIIDGKPSNIKNFYIPLEVTIS